jgi:drug/metabolite transporter (DMT)-like permease
MMNFLSETRLATLCLLFSATMWGLIWYPLRVLEEAGLSAIWSTFAMYSAAAIVSLPYLIKHKFFKQLNRDLIGIGMAAGITNLAFLMALIEGDVMRVMLLFYLSPIWSVMLSRWWLKETLSPLAIIMLVIAMGGSLVMLWNPDMGLPWPSGLGDWLALIGSLAFSVNNVLARKLGNVPMAAKVGSIWWGVIVVSVLALGLLEQPIPQVSPQTWLLAVSMGIFGMIAMNVSVLYGLAKMPIYRSSVIMLFELVVAAISASLLTEELMSIAEWIGGTLIVLAGYGVAISEQQNENGN